MDDMDDSLPPGVVLVLKLGSMAGSDSKLLPVAVEEGSSVEVKCELEDELAWVASSLDLEVPDTTFRKANPHVDLKTISHRIEKFNGRVHKGVYTCSARRTDDSPRVKRTVKLESKPETREDFLSCELSSCDGGECELRASDNAPFCFCGTDFTNGTCPGATPTPAVEESMLFPCPTMGVMLCGLGLVAAVVIILLLIVIGLIVKLCGERKVKQKLVRRLKEHGLDCSDLDGVESFIGDSADELAAAKFENPNHEELKTKKKQKKGKEEPPSSNWKKDYEKRDLLGSATDDDHDEKLPQYSSADERNSTPDRPASDQET